MISHQDPLIAERGPKDPHCLPTPPGGNCCFVNRNNPSVSPQSGYDLIVFHNRQISKAPDLFKQGPGEEKPLVAVGSLEPARADASGPLNERFAGKLLSDAEAEGACGGADGSLRSAKQHLPLAGVGRPWGFFARLSAINGCSRAITSV